MMPQKPLKERLPALGAIGLALVAAAYLGLRNQRPAAPITFTAPAAAAQALYQADAVAPPKEMVVHVVGAVNRPQVLRLKPDSRVQEAILASGGAKADADLESLNLAAKLIDGTQLYVPTKSAKSQDSVAEAYRGGPMAARPYQAKPSAPRGGGTKQPSGPVSLNTGSQAQLETIPGLGPSTAQSIIDYRQAHGGFARIEEIMEVRGIGAKKFSKMKKWLRL